MREQAAIRWLQLTYKVPSEPSQKRVWVWRRLQNMGAFALQNSVYLLPSTDEVAKQFHQLARDIRELGGEASIFTVTAEDETDEKRILEGLLTARIDEYDAALRVCVRFLATSKQLITDDKWPEQVKTELEELLEKVHVLWRAAKRHDLLADLSASKRTSTSETIAACEQILHHLYDNQIIQARQILEQVGDISIASPTNTTLTQGVLAAVAGEELA